jgi:coenzyme PQQ synthesis protein D (PqqD)
MIDGCLHNYTEFNMQSLNIIVQKAPSIVSRKIADEVILVPISHKVGEIDCLYALNEVGARIWELLDGTRSLKEVRDAIVQEFEVSETEAEGDLTMLIEQLKEVGAIQEVPVQL